jgi:hypothetical protein
VRISPELVLTPRFVERARGIVGEAGSEGITVSAFRERLGDVPEVRRPAP